MPTATARRTPRRKRTRAMPGRVTVVRPGPHHRTGRRHRSLHLLARAHRARRRNARARRRHRPRADHRRPRSRGIRSIKLVENRTFGVFNAVGPDHGQPFKEFVDRMHKGVDGAGTFTWVDTDSCAPTGRVRTPTSRSGRSAGAHRGFRALRPDAGAQGGPQVPADRAHGERHARVVPETERGWIARGESRDAAGTRSRTAGVVEGAKGIDRGSANPE